MSLSVLHCFQVFVNTVILCVAQFPGVCGHCNSLLHSFQLFVDTVILCVTQFQVFVDTVSLFVYTVLHCFQSLWMRRRILLKQSWTLLLSVSHCLHVLVDTFSVSVVLFPVSDDTLGLSVSVALFPGVG